MQREDSGKASARNVDTRRGNDKVAANDLDLTLQRPVQKVPPVEAIWETLNEQGSELSRLKTDHKSLQKEADRLRSKLRVASDEAEALRTCLDTSGVLPKNLLEEKVKDAREARKVKEREAKESREKETPTEKGVPSTGDEPETKEEMQSAKRSSEASAVSATESAPPVAPVAELDTTRLAPNPKSVAKSSSKGRGRGKGRSSKPQDSADPEGEAKNWKSPLGPTREAEEEEKGEKDSVFSYHRKPLVNNNLYDLAKPFLRLSKKDKDKPVIKGESRARAFYAFEECLRRGISPLKWDGPSNPLASMVKSQEIEMVDLLMRARATPDEVDEKGVSVMHTLSFQGDGPMLKCLLDGKANPDVPDKHGQTPMFFAHKPGICALLYTYKADPTVMNVKGQSSLHLAARAGNESVLRWLIQHVSREVLDLKDKHGATATYYARQAGVKHSVVASLYFHKPEVDRFGLHERDLVKHPHRVGEDQIGAGPPGSHHKGGVASHVVEKPKVLWDFADIHKDDGPKQRPPFLRRKGDSTRKMIKPPKRAKSTGAISSRPGDQTLRPEEVDDYIRQMQEEQAARVIQAAVRRSVSAGGNGLRARSTPKGRYSKQRKAKEKQRAQFVDDVDAKSEELERQIRTPERQRTQITQSSGSKAFEQLAQVDQSTQNKGGVPRDDFNNRRTDTTLNIPLSARRADEASSTKPSLSPSSSSRRPDNSPISSNRRPDNSPSSSSRRPATQNKRAQFESSYAERKRRIDEEERRTAEDQTRQSSGRREKPDSDDEDMRQQRAAAELLQQKYRRSVVIRNIQEAPTDGAWALCKALRNQQAVRNYKENKVAKDRAREANVKDTYRGSIAGKILMSEGRDGEAATKIQARFRGNAARKRVKEQKEEKLAKELDALSELHDDAANFRTSILQEHNAAVKIQAQYRGNQARKSMAAEEVAGLAENSFGLGSFAGLEGLDLDMTVLAEEEDEEVDDGEEDQQAEEEAEEEYMAEEAEEEEGDNFEDGDEDEEVEDF